MEIKDVERRCLEIDYRVGDTAVTVMFIPGRWKMALIYQRFDWVSRDSSSFLPMMETIASNTRGRERWSDPLYFFSFSFLFFFVRVAVRYLRNMLRGRRK